MSGVTAGTLDGTDDGVEFKMKRKAAGKAKQTVTIGAKKTTPHVEKVKPPSKESKGYFALLNDNCLDYFPTLG